MYERTCAEFLESDMAASSSYHTRCSVACPSSLIITKKCLHGSLSHSLHSYIHNTHHCAILWTVNFNQSINVNIFIIIVMIVQLYKGALRACAVHHRLRNVYFILYIIHYMHIACNLLSNLITTFRSVCAKTHPHKSHI